MKRKIWVLLLAAVAGNVFAVSAWAQTLARVTGTVQSSGGEPIAGARVTATGRNLSGRSETTTAPDGTFALPQLPADTYQIVAEAPGYSESAVTVEVGVGQTRAVQIQLNGLAESTVITVSKDAATADLSSVRLSVNVTPIEVSAMPLNGRSYSILTLFAPGAANRADGGFDKLSFSGQPNSFNRYSFDGIDASSVIDPNPWLVPRCGHPVSSANLNRNNPGVPC